MTLLAASVFVHDRSRDLPAADQAFRQGADAVELRIDAFDGAPAEIADFVKTQPHRKWIITCRSAEEGGLFRGDTMERVSRLIAAARGTGAYVDFELSDWRRSSNIRQKVLLAVAAPGTSGCRLILSHHDFSGSLPDCRAIVAEVRAAGVEAIAKVAYRCDHIVDSFSALDLMHEFGNRVIAVAMGEDGAWTRVLAKKLGAFATFCSLDADSGTAPGQAALDEMLDPQGLRWGQIGAATRVFGVIGDPIAHSKSPALFNRWFAQMSVDAVYLPFRVRGGKDQLVAFLQGCADREWLNVGGFSVTVPHKQSALAWVGEGADSLSQRIGAANTLVFRGGADKRSLSVAAHNTDCYAAIASLAEALGRSTVDLAGLKVDVLGAGGAAKAMVEGLNDVGVRVTVYARSQSARERLVQQHGCATRPWDERARRDGEVLINCTPIGMSPRVGQSPMPVDALGGCRLVFDLIYNPLETALLRDARAAGCATLNGLDMFIRQAAAQFELWTGQRPDILGAQRLLRSRLAPGAAASLHKRGQGGVGCIALIGMRGSGKTTVGRELAASLGGSHVDTDDLIAQRAGRAIVEIFASEGEAGFRRRESQIIREVLQSPPAVLSVGGGAVLDPGNVVALRAAAAIVWLTAPSEVLHERIARDASTSSNRPPLTVLHGVAELEELLARRTATYRGAADLTIDTSGRSPREIAQEIARQIQKSNPSWT